MRVVLACLLLAVGQSHAEDAEPTAEVAAGKPNWAGRWETDMGGLLFAHLGREVYGKLEQSEGTFSGVTTTDPRIVIGQLKMTAFTGGFRIHMSGPTAQEFSGVWWKEGSKDRLPWSGKRALVRKTTKRVEGDMNLAGNLGVNTVKAEGQLSAKGISSNTITNPSSQGGLPYLLSGVSCKWTGIEFTSCGGKGNSTGTQAWGGYANVKSAKAKGPQLTVRFTTPYMGNPFCFVSFGGKDTTAHYSLDAHADRVEIFLKKKGCCAMDWTEFNDGVSLVCHGASAGGAGPVQKAEPAAAATPKQKTEPAVAAKPKAATAKAIKTVTKDLAKKNAKVEKVKLKKAAKPKRV